MGDSYLGRKSSLALKTTQNAFFSDCFFEKFCTSCIKIYMLEGYWSASEVRHLL